MNKTTNSNEKEKRNQINNDSTLYFTVKPNHDLKTCQTKERTGEKIHNPVPNCSIALSKGKREFSYIAEK